MEVGISKANMKHTGPEGSGGGPEVRARRGAGRGGNRVGMRDKQATPHWGLKFMLRG